MERILNIINLADIKRYYRFLNHSIQTEIRVIEKNHFGPVPSIFCNSENEFIEACKKYNGNHQVYAGINERTLDGTHDVDVGYITNIGHDVDCHEENSNLEIAKEVCLKYCKDVIKEGLEEPMIIFSGSGYWILHHTKPIKNTSENRQKIKIFASLVKKHYEIQGINFDTKVYNPSRIGRVAGTINLKNGKIAKIINNPNGIACSKFKQQIDSMKLPIFDNTTVAEIPKGKCAFMNYCMAHKLPNGERHSIIDRNLSLYIYERLDREKLRQQYAKVQEGTKNSLNSWLLSIEQHPNKKYPFSCGELISYQFRNNIPLQCENCPLFKKSVNRLGPVRGWANKISIIEMAKEHNMTKCPECGNKFSFQDSHCLYFCKTCKKGGGLKKFSKLIVEKKK